MGQYLYKIKSKNRNIETLGKFGFQLVMPADEDSIAEVIFAKSVSFGADTPVGMWVIKNLEEIYKRADDDWKLQLRSNGLEFTEDGYLKLTDKVVEDLKGQLCVFATGEDTGMLFLNLDSVEFYTCTTLSMTLPEEIKELEDAKIIYKKEFNEKSDGAKKKNVSKKVA